MTMKKVSGDLAKNRDYLDRQLGVGESFDVLYRNVEIGKKNAALYMIDGFCKDEVMQKLLQHFHPQLCASDPAADQRRVKDNGFHKTVLRTAQHLILFRLTDTSRRIGSGIDQNALLISLQQQGGHAGHHLPADFIQIVA